MLLAGLIGNSPPIRHVREQIARLLDRPLGARLPPVLLEGETGTGKGLLVREMQRAGPRRQGSVRRRQLRRYSRNATGGGDVRVRARRLHGRTSAQGWSLRDGRRRNPLPR